MISNTSKYAIRAMIYLAIHAEPKRKIGIKAISKALNIPAPFLSKILQVLAKYKLLSSTKGPNGGFFIAKDPHKISLFEIVTLIDGEDTFNTCLISQRTCHEENKPCPIHDKYEPIRNELRKLFTGQNIGDLALEKNSQNQFIVL
jgi:Rrf2 family transcriptional regulator, iron-sulfur cluster assembly transcription factor